MLVNCCSLVWERVPPHKYKYLHADGKTACCNDGSVKSAVVVMVVVVVAAAIPITRY